MFELFDPSAEYAVTESCHLPHWYQPGAACFITFRTDDSIPKDTFAQFGDETALPIFGNFDPPVASTTESTNLRTLTNSSNEYDVNNDGSVTALDALTIINAVSRGNTEAKASQSARLFATFGNFLDVNASEDITALDALMIINQLSRQNGPEGESDATVSGSDGYITAVDQVLMNGLDDDKDDWLELEEDRRLNTLV